MPLDRSAILAAEDLPKEEIQIPEWSGSVFVRTMTGTERDRFEAAHLKNPHSDIRARLAVAAVCDEAGAPLFTEADIPAVGKKSAAALDRIFAAAMRLSKIGAADVKELEGNS